MNDKQISFILKLINGLFIVAIILHTFSAGDAGEAFVEGDAMIITGMFITNLVFGILILIFRISWYKKNGLWLGLVIVLTGPISWTVMGNMRDNYRQEHFTLSDVKYHQPVPHEVYMQDSSSLKAYYRNNSVVLDTIIYSLDKTRMVAFFAVKVDTNDTSRIHTRYYKNGYFFDNFELFIEKKNQEFYSHHPTCENFNSEDATLEGLKHTIYEYYFYNFSLDDEAARLYMWNDQCFWSKDIDTLRISKNSNIKKISLCDTINLVDTNIAGVMYKLSYSLAEYQKESPSPFKAVLTIKRQLKIISDTIELESTEDTAHLQPLILIMGNKARNSNFFCKDNLVMFQLAVTQGQPLEILYVYHIENDKANLLTCLDGKKASILSENGFIVNESNLKIMALEYYHYSQSYTARIYTIGNEKNLEHLKELKIPENEYQDDKIFKNVSQQIGLCRKYLQ